VLSGRADSAVLSGRADGGVSIGGVVFRVRLSHFTAPTLAWSGARRQRPALPANETRRGDPMMYWCLGMYGSASTWTFNVVLKLATALNPEHPVTSQFVGSTLPDFGENGGPVVVKTHATGIADELSRRAEAIVITIRDPRDAVASLMTHLELPFDFALGLIEATALTCARFATDPRAVLLKFEDRFYDRPETIDRLAALLPGTLTDDARIRIFLNSRREFVELFIAGLENLPTFRTELNQVTGRQLMFDQVTQWHKHHSGRKAEVGRWRRELSGLQVARIEARLRGWMESYGYLAAVSRVDHTAPIRQPLIAHVVTAHAATAHAATLHSGTPEARASRGEERRDTGSRHAATGGENIPLSS
jgi:hypothetical protein